MPVNITFAGRAYEDGELLEYAYAFERATRRRVGPPLEALKTDIAAGGMGQVRDGTALELAAEVRSKNLGGGKIGLGISGTIGTGGEIQVFVDGKEAWRYNVTAGSWSVQLEHAPVRKECLGWDLKPLPPKKAMVIVVARGKDGKEAGSLKWADIA